MVVYNKYFIFLVLGLSSLSLSAQKGDDCYKYFLQEGLKAQERFDYDQAINKFEAAFICPDKPLENNLDEILKKVNEEKISALKEATYIAKKLEKKARESEQEALQQLLISESNRLAFFSDQEREKGNTEGAIKLAYRAMQVGGQKASLAVQRAFGDAVFEATKKELKGHHKAIRSVEFSADGNLLLTVSRDSTIIIWNRDGEKLLHLQDFKSEIQSAHFSPDARELLVASGNKLELWNLKNQRKRRLNGHQDLVYQAIFSNNGQTIASCSRDRTINIWDFRSGKLIATCKGHEAAVNQLQFSKNDSNLLSLSSDKSIRVWNLKGEMIHKIVHNNLYFGGAIFGPGEDQLLSFTVDNAIQLWEIEGQRLLFEINGHQRIMRRIAIPPDASGFLSCATDGQAVFWDTVGNEQFRLDDHLAPLRTIKFSKDGNFLLSCSDDGTAKLYTTKGQLLMNLYSFSGPVNDVAISPDNQQIVTVGYGETAFLCQNPRTYYPQLEKSPPEAFTEKEKQKYTIRDLAN